VAVVIGLGLALPGTFVGFGLGGAVGLAVLGDVLGEANEHVALIAGSVVLGALSLLVACAIGKLAGDAVERVMLRERGSKSRKVE
jgi:hypothetical protein